MASSEELAGRVWCVAFSPDCSVLATGSHSGLKLWNVATREVALTLKHAEALSDRLLRRRIRKV